MNRWYISVLVLLLVLAPGPSEATSITLLDKSGSELASLDLYDQQGTPTLNLFSFYKSLGYEPEWDPAVDQLTLHPSGGFIRLQAGMNRALLEDGRLVRVGRVLLHKGRPYLAVEAAVGFTNEQLGESLLWNRDRRQIQRGAQRGSSESAGPDRIGNFLKNQSQEESRDGTREQDDQFIVMIDPGHGGRDPGAISNSGLMEKTVVLQMSLRLKEVLDKQYPGIKAKMTRKTDRFIPLDKRTKIANRENADLFVSIHANSSRSVAATGFSVFTLGGNASDHLAAELAKVENSSLRYQGYSKKELNQVQWILAQLMKTVNTRESQELAKYITLQFDRRLEIRNRGVKQAPFWVLKDAGMPSVLVETGFLSNPTEERKLRKDGYQQSVARGLAHAIDRYKNKKLRSARARP